MAIVAVNDRKRSPSPGKFVYPILIYERTSWVIAERIIGTPTLHSILSGLKKPRPTTVNDPWLWPPRHGHKILARDFAA